MSFRQIRLEKTYTLHVFFFLFMNVGALYFTYAYMRLIFGLLSSPGAGNKLGAVGLVALYLPIVLIGAVIGATIIRIFHISR
jgi:hypothetical protein